MDEIIKLFLSSPTLAVAERVKCVRQHLKLSQKDFAAIVHLHPSEISKFERYFGSFTERSAKKFAHYLKMPIECWPHTPTRKRAIRFGKMHYTDE